MVFISRGIFLFADEQNKCNSYLLTDALGNLVIVDPTEATVKQIVQPLSDKEDEEQLVALIFTSVTTFNLAAIKYATEKNEHLDVYMGASDLNFVKKETKEELALNGVTLKELEDHLEIHEIVLNIWRMPGISPGAVCLKYKNFFMTGVATAVPEDASQYCVNTTWLHEKEWAESLKKFTDKMQPTYFICPYYGPVVRYKQWVLDHPTLNTHLEELLK